ncbi:hypothetical protein MLD38_023230 [Melastoma candidum]|uniref:Uncharacterized protein n=1 Tax=Melastoma candidum TaxID=119954 RepID=A0ACB9QLT0_9MYRT|nr:hypothetical protein MLD38_023230 [Melastoma candidum]
MRVKASNETPGLVQEVRRDQSKRVEKTKFGPDFTEIEQRFLAFKKHEYMENIELYNSLSKSQAPKFMAIACADSRVCPSVILGFKPGEAFIVRNVANLVPPYEGGPSETNAALEFAVNSLEVEDILVIGHSCCGGIRALMGMKDTEDTSFIKNWVMVGKKAKISTQAAASDLTFDQQCRHCEKESVNRSLLNLLSYPWIEEQVIRGKLSIHGGYYNFVNCTFEKWTLDYFETSSKANNGALAVKSHSLWS